MSGRYRDWSLDCKVYVGNLQENAIKSDVENAFNKYGSLKNVWVARNPPGFAFVEFEDPRDAEDAVRGLDGTWVSFFSHLFGHFWILLEFSCVRILFDFSIIIFILVQFFDFLFIILCFYLISVWVFKILKYTSRFEIKFRAKIEL